MIKKAIMKIVAFFIVSNKLQVKIALTTRLVGLHKKIQEIFIDGKMVCPKGIEPLTFRSVV